MILTTGIYAMGDARYYSRLEMPNMISGVPTTDAQIIAAHQGCAAFSASKLIAVQRSLYYDASGIPDADPNVESRLKILVRFANGNAKQFEIPMCENEPSKQEIKDALSGLIFDNDGSELVAVVKIDTPPERRARGK